MKRWEVHHADCRDAMRAMETESVDAVVTDPPYGLSFMGREWDHGVPGVEFWRDALRVAKPGAHLLAFGGTRTFHRLACAIEDAGWEVRDCLSWLYGSGFPKSLNVGGGRGTALKPAWEPILLARKPLDGTVASNVTKHGTGALNIDATRIGTDSTRRVSNAGTNGAGWRMGTHANLNGSDSGRWPANVALDEEAAVMLDAQTGTLTSGVLRAGTRRRETAKGGYGGGGVLAPGAVQALSDFGGDSGGASRFFYCAKASRSEREAGCEDLEPKQRDEARKQGDPRGDNPRNRGAQERKNSHPTVKPLALMRWLVRLVCQPGGLVLDPFNGSGSTGVAALAEGMRYVGCEREAEYVEIARRRLASPWEDDEHDESDTSDKPEPRAAVQLELWR